LQGFGATTREVTFTATGGTQKSWTKTVSFTPATLGGIGTVPLEDVPAGTTAISAKTAWNLRSKLPATFTGGGVAAVSLTGTDMLPGGDLNGDNVVNLLDYSLLRYHWSSTINMVADIDGSGVIFTGDYNLLKSNFYTIGDAQ
jgi:hypothetical protein